MLLRIQVLLVKMRVSEAGPYDSSLLPTSDHHAVYARGQNEGTEVPNDIGSIIKLFISCKEVVQAACPVTFPTCTISAFSEHVKHTSNHIIWMWRKCKRVPFSTQFVHATMTECTCMCRLTMLALVRIHYLFPTDLNRFVDMFAKLNTRRI